MLNNLKQKTNYFAKLKRSKVIKFVQGYLIFAFYSLPDYSCKEISKTEFDEFEIIEVFI